MTETYDFVVVGGGSAGCVVAARLAETGRHRVILLEAGPDHRRFWLDMPLGYARAFHDPTVNWKFISEPVPTLDGRRILYPRGKVLGGSSSINALVYSRGLPEDFDAWEAEGNPGWGWRHVLPVFRRLEDHFLGAGETHGAGGPLHVSDPSPLAHPLCRAFFRAASEAGYPFNPDLNGERIEGVGHYQITTKAGRRHSAARAYLDPVRGRPNLRIVTGAQATRVLLEGGRAVGVAYVRDGAAREARAGREVILCAGAIGSPQLLQLSGIGPEEELRRLGVPVVRATPAVGRHLHDHVSFDLYFRSRVRTLNDVLRPWWRQVLVGMEYVVLRRGLLTTSLNQAGGFVRTRSDRPRPNAQLYFCPIAYEKPDSGYRVVRVAAEPAYSLGASLCRPRARGYVRLRSPDPLAAPEIHPNLLGDEADVEEAIEAFDLVRRVTSMPALAEVTAAETTPGPDVRTHEEALAYLRATGYSIFHPCGTCRMGPDAARSVVDPTLRVHGMEGLRVIDASIFPMVPAANTNAPAIMVGEKGAAMILEKSG
jgi:choline dehydrogenase